VFEPAEIRVKVAPVVVLGATSVSVTPASRSE
jgi:hypothetical protein